MSEEVLESPVSLVGSVDELTAEIEQCADAGASPT
jgi:hypothetical protein